MAYTQAGVLKQLGKDAQITGGTIIVYREGKHIEVAYVRSEGGEFVVTDAGKELLEATADKPARAPKAAKAAAEETAE